MKKNLLLLVLGISLNATAQMYIDTTCVSLNTLDEQPVYMVTQKKAEFPNGLDSLSKYLATSIKYSQETEYKGMVVVTFIIDSIGKVRNPCMYKRFRSDYLTEAEKECMRVIDEMPMWQPAEMRGKKVYSRIYLPTQLQ